MSDAAKSEVEMETAAQNAETVTAGQTWGCNEGRADGDAVPDPHDVPLWAEYPVFRAVVDEVHDGVAELTVSISNSHPRSPELGTTIDVAVESLREDQRWRLTNDTMETTE